MMNMINEKDVASWTFPVIGFVFYVITYVAGYFIHIPSISLIGAVGLILSVMLVGGGKMYKSIDVTVKIAILMMIVVIFSSLLNADLLLDMGAPSVGYTMKYFLIFFLYVLVVSKRLPPLALSDKQIWMLLACLIVIVISLMTHNIQVMDFHSRESGVFVTPNSFALFSLSLLLFIEQIKSMYVKLFLHSLVFYTLFVASGSGALLAYCVGMIYKYSTENRSLKISYLLLSVLLVSLIYYLSWIFHVKAIDGVTEKVIIFFRYAPIILNGADLDYSSLYKDYGSAVLSGLWRLDHWRALFEDYFSGSVLQLLLGFGAGHSFVAIGNSPHNDFLRFLYEFGLAGFLLIVSFYFFLMKKIRRQYKPVLVIFLVYSLTDNNIDCFLFISVFILTLASSINPEFSNKDIYENHSSA